MRRLAAVIIPLILVMCLTGCGRETDEDRETDITEAVSGQEEADGNVQEGLEQGFHLPVSQSDKEHAREDTEKVLDCIEDMYQPYLGDETPIPEEVQEDMADVLAENGYPVRAGGIYSNIKNETVLEEFLIDAKEGRQGSAVLYRLGSGAAVVRYAYSFDGSDMYVLSSRMEMKPDGARYQTYCAYTRIKSWRYTDAGWFCYELCVPEYPEVSEMIDGSVLIRVKPISEENKRASEKYVLGIGYQGNNLLCSNWNADSLDTLDYTGIYEYLYAMDTGDRFVMEEDADGIPADQFENLIMKYIPASQEIIRRSAAFNEESGEYCWARLGCMNYAPTCFGTSYPEVVDIKENDDGTITLTVNAVCEMVLNNEAVITHELTIKEKADGSFLYMGNQILDDGINRIPDYQYRIRVSDGGNA